MVGPLISRMECPGEDSLCEKSSSPAQPSEASDLGFIRFTWNVICKPRGMKNVAAFVTIKYEKVT